MIFKEGDCLFVAAVDRVEPCKILRIEVLQPVAHSAFSVECASGDIFWASESSLFEDEVAAYVYLHDLLLATLSTASENMLVVLNRYHFFSKEFRKKFPNP